MDALNVLASCVEGVKTCNDTGGFDYGWVGLIVVAAVIAIVAGVVFRPPQRAKDSPVNNLVCRVFGSTVAVWQLG